MQIFATPSSVPTTKGNFGYPRWVNGAYRAQQKSKGVFAQVSETALFFGHKQWFGAYPLLGFIGIMASGIWLNNLRYQQENYYSSKADGSEHAGGGH